jgi:hypothetical protein
MVQKNSIKALSIALISIFFYSMDLYAQDIDIRIEKSIYTVGEEIVFKNNSSDFFKENYFIWNFGNDCGKNIAYIFQDCNIEAMGLQSETYKYNQPGIYIVTLYPKGREDLKIQKEVTIIQKQINQKAYKLQNPKKNELNINGNFESYSFCPTKLGQINASVSWDKATPSTPDYFNSCFNVDNYDWNLGLPSNFAGNALDCDSLNGYSGLLAYMVEETSSHVGNDQNSIFHNYREYIQTELSDPLIEGEKYIIQFKTRLSSKSRIASKVGLLISNNKIWSSSTTVLNYTPSLESGIISDTSNWILISDTIIADGGERFITIGNFNIDSSINFSDLYASNKINSVYKGFGAYISYYYIDNVVVKRMYNEIAERTTIVSSGGSLVCDSFILDYTIGQRVINTLKSDFYYLTQGFQQPSESKKYFINKEQSLVDQTNKSFIYYPNPCNDNLNIFFKDEIKDQKVQIVIYDVYGNLQSMSTSYTDDNANQHISININQLKTGFYFIKIFSENNSFSSFKIFVLN